jgi:glycerol uptake facilitator-like aquaporin
MQADLGRRLLAESLGSALLAGAVIGSGILGQRLSGGNDAIALLGNSAATGAILFVLITALGPISGAHFNPAVSLVMLLRRQLSARAFMLYAAMQVFGCIAGAILAHAMFELPLVHIATHARAGAAQMFSEAVATFTLVFAILAAAHWRKDALPAVVALVITAGYWWTASTSFANPAITIARAMSDTFAGVRPEDAPGLIAGQFVGALVAAAFCAALFPDSPPHSRISRHESPEPGSTEFGR